MFASNSNTKDDFPIHQNNPFEQQNPNNYSFLDISSSHLLDDNELFLVTVLPSQPPPPPPRPPPPPPPPPPVDKGKRKRAGGGPTTTVVGPKKRRGKDRHSKIYTAHGPRDRRMRLSLQIARKFFDLQDLLGFDKASKTIEWLFNKSKAAIKDLAEKSCTSFTPPSPPEEVNNRNKEKIMSERSINKQMGGLQAKENREKARARARERTKEKLMMQKEVTKSTLMKNKQPLENEQNPSSNMENTRAHDQMQKLGFDNHDDHHHHLSLEDQMASVGIIEKFLASTSSSISNFNNQVASNDQIMRSNNIDVMDFSENWVTENSRFNDGYETGFNNIDSTFMGRPYNEGN